MPTDNTSKGLIIEVLITQGATVLVRMLSFAHSHAKFFVSWFMAPASKVYDRFY